MTAALSSTVYVIEGHVDAAAANGVHWGSQFALTTILSHFYKLKLELELLGSVYNTDLMKDEMDVFRTRAHWASESLSSRVPPSVARNQRFKCGQFCILSG
jgi:hypothetical protein